MWLLSFIPDGFLLWIVNTILLVGAIGSFLTFFVLHKILNRFPAIAPYYLLLQIISAVLLVAGIYFKGGYSVEMSWRERVAELEKKVKDAEDKSTQANLKLANEIKDKKTRTAQTKIIIEKRITEIEKKIDADCKIDQDVINILNDSAKNQIRDKK